MLYLSCLFWTASCFPPVPVELPAGHVPQQGETERGVLEMEQELRGRAWHVAVKELPKSAPGRWDDWTAQTPAPQVAVDPYDFAYEAFRKGDPVLAAGYLQRLLMRVPDYPAALQLLAMSYGRMERFEDSVACWQRLLAVAPQAIGRTRSYARDLVELERFEEAIAHTTRLLEAEPEHALVLGARGAAHLGLGQVDAAGKDLRKALQSEPEHPTLLFRYAVWMSEGDDPKGAYQAALAARDAAPFEARTWELVSRAASALGSQEETAQAALARHEELRRVEQAIRPLRSAWQRNPHQLDKLEQIADLYREINHLDRAETEYQRCAVWAREFEDSATFQRALRALKDLR